MAVFSEIKQIRRDTEISGSLSATPQRERSMRVVVELHDEYKGQYNPDYWLTDDRLPALFSAYPAVPYPTTTTTTPATFVAWDADCLLYDVSYTTNGSLSLITYDYKYSTNPNRGGQPGQFPEAIRRDQNTGSPGSDLGFSFAYSSEEIEVPYRRDAGDDPDAFISGIPAGSKDVLNTAGDRYEQQPTRKFPITVCTIQRLELFHRRRFWESWAYVKNRYWWNDKLPGEVCSWPVQIGNWQAHGTSLLYPVTYTFKWLNKEAIPAGMLPEIESQTFWDDILLSYGYQELGQAADDLIPIYSKPGLATRVPQPLDAFGVAIRPPDSASPASTTYLKLLYRDFDLLGLTLPADVS